MSMRRRWVIFFVRKDRLMLLLPGPGRLTTTVVGNERFAALSMLLVEMFDQLLTSVVYHCINI